MESGFELGMTVGTALPLKLLVIEPDPSFGGGSEAVMLSLSHGLAQRGHEMSLLHEHDGSALADYRALCSRVVQQPLPGFALRAPMRTLDCVGRIGKLARAMDIDVIMSSHLGFLRHCAMIRRLFGVPSCFHLGLALDRAPTSLRLAMPHIGAGVAPSAHTLATWRAGGWNARTLHRVDNWVDPSRFKPAADLASLREEIGLPGLGASIVFVGRICLQKGVDVLLRAFPQVLARCPDATLHLVGPVAADFESQLKATLDLLGETARSRIHFRPVSATPEKFYAAADLVCAPSIGDEAFGLTVLEAMACGVPVITTAIGMIAEIVGSEHAALVVPPGDCDALAERISTWLLRPAGTDGFGASLRQRALRNYGPDRGVDQYQSILLGLVARQAGNA